MASYARCSNSLLISADAILNAFILRTSNEFDCVLAQELGHVALNLEGYPGTAIPHQRLERTPADFAQQFCLNPLSDRKNPTHRETGELPIAQVVELP